MPNLIVRKVESWKVLQRLSPTWNQLVSESSSRTIFLTWDWLTSWWQVYQGSRELMLLVCGESDGPLVALAPLYRTTVKIGPGLKLRVLRIVGDGSEDSDNLDWIIREGYEAPAVQAFADWLEQHSSQWDVLELNTVPSESPVGRQLTAALVTSPWWTQ